MKTSALFLAIMLTILEFRSDAFSPHVGRKLVTRRAQNRRGSSPGHLDCCTSLFYKNGDSDEGLQSPETREIFYNPVHEEVDPWKLPKIKVRTLRLGLVAKGVQNPVALYHFGDFAAIFGDL